MTEDERAEQAIQFYQELAMRQHQQAHALTGASLSECAECGDEIPPERQAALQGVRLCVDCKRIDELHERRYG